jgi:hypothetical protein
MCQMKPIQFSILAACMICRMPLMMRTVPRTLLAAISETAGTRIAAAPAAINTLPRRTSQTHLSRNTSAV